MKIELLEVELIALLEKGLGSVFSESFMEKVKVFQIDECADDGFFCIHFENRGEKDE